MKEVENLFCIVEYTRWSRETKRRIAVDLMGILLSISDSWLLIKTKDDKMFLIPKGKVENVKVLGKPKW